MAWVGASNFFELSVAVSISLFGLVSGATLTTVVGVLVEVPVMLALVKFANSMENKFNRWIWVKTANNNQVVLIYKMLDQIYVLECPSIVCGTI